MPVPFSIDWRRVPSDEPVVLEGPALLVSSAAEVPPGEIQALHARCQAAGRPLAIVMPSPPPSLLQELRLLGVAAFEATTQPGQPVSALLEDVAIYAGAALLSKDLGWTMSVDPDADYSPLVLPTPWSPRVEELGHLRRLEYTAGRLTLAGQERNSEQIARRVASLRAWPAASDVEEAGLRRRLERLGVGAVEIKRAPLPSFERTRDMLRVPSGLRSPYLITDGERMEARLSHPDVLVSRHPLSGWRDMAALLRWAARKPRPSPLLIVVPEVADEAVAVLVINKLRGIVAAVAVEVGDESWREAISEFSDAKTVQQDFDAEARIGTVADVACDAHAVTLSRGR